MGLQDNSASNNLKRLLKSFKYASSGLVQTSRMENNFQIELIVAVVVIMLSVILNISKSDWLIVIMCIGLVLTMELLNTAVEAVVDLVTKGEYQSLAKVAKDCAAAAVLCISITVCIIGLMIFIPYIVDLF